MIPTVRTASYGDDVIVLEVDPDRFEEYETAKGHVAVATEDGIGLADALDRESQTHHEASLIVLPLDAARRLAADLDQNVTRARFAPVPGPPADYQTTGRD